MVIVSPILGRYADVLQNLYQPSRSSWSVERSYYNMVCSRRRMRNL